MNLNPNLTNKKKKKVRNFINKSLCTVSDVSIGLVKSKGNALNYAATQNCVSTPYDATFSLYIVI